MSLHCPLVSTLLSAANPERQERDLEREGVGEWEIGPNLLPTWSWLPFSQAPRSKVGPWHEGQARVDMKLGLSRPQLDSPLIPPKEMGCGIQEGVLGGLQSPWCLEASRTWRLRFNNGDKIILTTVGTASTRSGI